MKHVDIYTDGACRGNGKDNAAGGFGVVVLDDNQNIVDLYSKQCEGTTNNREELKAILYVMLKYGRHITDWYGGVPTVFSDSAYCVNTFNDWMFRWANNGWIKSDKKPALNPDLWEILLDLTAMHTLHYHTESTNHFRNHAMQLFQMHS